VLVVLVKCFSCALTNHNANRSRNFFSPPARPRYGKMIKIRDEVGVEIENAFQLLPLQQLAAAVQNGVRQQFITDGGGAEAANDGGAAIKMPGVPK